ncbi:DUF4352 domain-containing protein [Prescottella equi]|jgi:hypothetical protein|uniref:DUF4352 domain-containing protein n=1 Tax=Rhodococcus hoagii TaxID=43767 RepID=UPI000A108087|nr:DUF4352 domain-containing protein [Prescottella equi]ORJ92239.1 hypothetical protein A6F55_24390 [Prescottella equi]ORL97901.1 hypothetical protein A5N72_23590 [Prescottella equi]BCN52125.1 hypothetical protein RE9425_05150 [Prescottella equi]
MTFDPNQPGGQPGQPGQPYSAYPQNPYGAPPQPPKKKRRWGLWIILAVVLLLFAGCVAAIAGSGDDKATVVDNGSGDTGSGSGTGSGDAAAEGLDFPGKKSKDTGANAGATVDKKGLQITSSPLAAVEQKYGSPLLCTMVTVVNNTGKQQDFSGYLDWKLQDPNGVAKDPTFAMDQNMLESGELAPGGRAEGNVCFNDPSVPGQYVVLMEEFFSFNNARIGWINQI